MFAITAVKYCTKVMAMQQWQQQHNNGKGSGDGGTRRDGDSCCNSCTDGSGVGKCGGGGKHCAIDLHTMAMAVATAAPKQW